MVSLILKVVITHMRAICQLSNLLLIFLWRKVLTTASQKNGPQAYDFYMNEVTIICSPNYNLVE